MKRNIVGAIDERINTIKPRDAILGTVMSLLSGNIARVTLRDGTMAEIHVPFSVEPGDTLICQRPQGSDRWMATGAENKSITGTMYGTNPIRDEEIAKVRKPFGLEAISVAGALIFQWGSYPDFAGGFEVQVAYTHDQSDAEYAIATKGTHYVVEDADYAYVRVRAVNSHFVRTGWTDWVVGVAEGHAALIAAFRVGGALAVAEGVDCAWVIPNDCSIVKVSAWCRSIISGGDVVVDINVNGATIFTTQANRPSLGGGEESGVVVEATPDITDVFEGDIITVDIDSVSPGGSLSPKDLSVIIELGVGAISLVLLAPSDLTAEVV